MFFTSSSFAVFTKELALSSNVTTMATCERKLSTFMMFFAAGASPEFVIVVNSFQWTRSRGALTESKIQRVRSAFCRGENRHKKNVMSNAISHSMGAQDHVTSNAIHSPL